jgi:hypothetical protein
MKNIPKTSIMKPTNESEEALVEVGTELAMLATTPIIKSPNTPAAAAKRQNMNPMKAKILAVP